MNFDYVGEIVVGLVLLAFAAGFSRWSVTLRDAMHKVMDKLDAISKEFHQHAITTERRVTRVETKIDSLAATEQDVVKKIETLVQQDKQVK